MSFNSAIVDEAEAVHEVEQAAETGRGKLVLRRFLRNKFAVGGIVVILLMFVMAFFSDDFYEWDFATPDFTALLSPPDGTHWFGTIQDGQDLFALCMQGLQKSLIIGLVVVNLWAPGTGMNVDAAALDTRGIATYTAKAGQQSTVEFLLHIIPNTVVGAFAEGEILQVLLIAILFAFALQSLGAHGRPVLHGIDMIAQVFFRIVGYVMKVAWLGAFGAMAFTIGRYGLSTLVQLGSLMAGFYATCLLFVVGVLGAAAALSGFSIFKFIRYIKEELLIVLGTSSSETVLPRMLAKLENLGCEKSIVGLVILIANRRLPRTRAIWPVVVGCVSVLVIGFINNLVHSRDAWTSVVPTGFALSALTVVVMLITAWAGFAAAYRPVDQLTYAGAE